MRRKLVDIPCVAALCNAGKSKHVLSKLYSGGVFWKNSVLALFKNYFINLNQKYQVTYPQQLFQNDNLNAQKHTTDNNELGPTNNVNVFPNSFPNNFFTDCSNVPVVKSIKTIVEGSSDKTVYQKNWWNTHYKSKTQVAANTFEPGIYLVNMIMGNNSKRITRKIIKY